MKKNDELTRHYFPYFLAERIEGIRRAGEYIKQQPEREFPTIGFELEIRPKGNGEQETA